MSDHAARVPTLSTERLKLRAFAPSDLDSYASICADPEVMRWIGAGGPIARDAAWRHMALYLGQWALRGYGIWAIERRSDRALIGSTGVLHPEGWPGVELSWLLGRSAWGQGFAFEAANAARAFARDELGIAALISLIREQNTRSIALAGRLGAAEVRRIEFLGAMACVFEHPRG